SSVVTRWVRPEIEHINAGLGAWEGALELPILANRTCTQCPFVLGSNLDCETCRGWILGLKQPGAAWSAQQIGEHLLGGCPPEVADAAAAALGETTQPPLTAAFFAEFAARFASQVRP